MSRFFYHLYEPAGTYPDREGIDVADAATAVLRARVELRHVLAGQLLEGRLSLDSELEVVDAITGTATRLRGRDVIALSGA